MFVVIDLLLFKRINSIVIFKNRSTITIFIFLSIIYFVKGLSARRIQMAVVDQVLGQVYVHGLRPYIRDKEAEQ